MKEAEEYIGMAIEGEVVDSSRKQEYQEHFQFYKRDWESLDLKRPMEEIKNAKEEKSWVEKMEDKKPSSLKAGVINQFTNYL